jgi:hypothetical protein
MNANTDYKETIASVAEFCNGDGPFSSYGLKKVITYQWPKKGPSVDELLKKFDADVQLGGTNNYEKNVSLKRYFAKRFTNNDLDVERASIWIIKDWGGIKKISKNLDQYIEGVQAKRLPTKIECIPSYSKLYAMFYPDDFAIYDARVAVSLNIIQLLAGKENAFLFPFLSGRNKVTGDSSKCRGFTAIPHFKSEQLLKSKDVRWQRPKPGRTYTTYNQILHSSLLLHRGSLIDVEMLLFSQAEELVHQMRSDERFAYADWSKIE